MPFHPSRHHAVPPLLLGLCLALPGAALPRTYEAVEVRGAKMIPEDDIRQTCGAEPGVYMEDIELRAIEDCLMSTGVFEAVSLKAEGDNLIIDVTEIEQSPGRFEASVFHTSDKGLTGGISYEQYNLLPDTFGAVHLEFSRDVKSVDASLYRPDQLGKDLDAGIDLKWERSDFEDLAFSVRNVQAEGYMAWTPDDNLRVEYGLGYRGHKMDGIDADASALLQSEATSIDAPFLRLGLTWATAAEGDDGKPTARGASAELDQYLWNIGTDDLLSETRVTLNARQNLAEKVELLLGLSGGIVAGLSDNDTRAIDRFYPGGDSFRGFAPRGIGPSDRGDMLGGNRYLIGSVELRRAFTFYDREYHGGVFYEIGSVWDLDNDLGGRIDDGWHSRSSIGLSLTFDLAGTPVSLYVAEPLRERPGDDRQSFGIKISATF
ncbi:BamA/TamA family outer membrane protein [Paracoccus caeni]|uniref:BamA/TamA family outer membrane protein n=1 Tax=Paracoccus caeni TaxID=657651 RepID=A0A934SBX3_9RHOB|nr:BamA/TamA family outer membrane protein [Paracoccus caeni]MBK4215991.1 BamA/TamA family outer membrane protein [Paracoccus caeni]